MLALRAAGAFLWLAKHKTPHPGQVPTLPNRRLVEPAHSNPSQPCGPVELHCCRKLGKQKSLVHSGPPRGVAVCGIACCLRSR